MQVNEILETCLYVDNLDVAERFYGTVLGLALVERHATRHLFFRCGNRMLLLFQPESVNNPESSTPHHGAQGVGHLAFAVPDEEIEGWRKHLEQHGVGIEKAVTWPQGGHSLYFRDPSGNSLELASPLIWHLDPRRTLGHQ